MSEAKLFQYVTLSGQSLYKRQPIPAGASSGCIGIRHYALSGLRVSWLSHFIPLHGMLVYAALSGQGSKPSSTSDRHYSSGSPEGASYANHGQRPSDNKIPSTTTSPEGARYTNDEQRPSVPKPSSSLSPEGASSANHRQRPSASNKNKTSPEGA